MIQGFSACEDEEENEQVPPWKRQHAPHISRFLDRTLGGREKRPREVRL